MRFSIIEEKEDELQVLLDCGDYFFKKQNKIIAYILLGLLFIFTFYLLFFVFNFDLSNKQDGTCFQIIIYFSMLIGLPIYLIFYAKSNNKPVIFEINPNGIIVKSRSDFVKDPVWIEKLNIKSIYVQVEKFDKYPIHKNNKENYYTVVLKTKKSIQLPNFKKNNFLLYRSILTENQYSNWLEPKLNKIKKMLHLSTQKNIKIVKQYDKTVNEIENFW